MFDPHDPELLARCVGLNAIFIRARSIEKYSKIDKDTRLRIKKFCREKVAVILSAIRPRKIVVLGMATIDPFGESCPYLRSDKGRPLARIGSVFGQPALAILHPSARITTEDRMAIARAVMLWQPTQ